MWIAYTLYQFDAPEGRPRTRINVTSSDARHTWTATYEWEIDHQLIVTTRVVDWSNDGKHLFFSSAIQASGCQTFTNGGDLSVLDLDTGAVRELVPMQDYGIGTWFSVSPDGSAAAFPADVTGTSITIVDLEHGGQRSIQLDFDDSEWGHRIGHIVWSPDMMHIAYTIHLNPCGLTLDGPFGTSVGIADTGALTSRTLYEDMNRVLITDSWLDATTIALSEPSKEPVFMDATSGTFVDR